MPKVTVCNSKNEEVGEIELNDEIFDVPIKPHVLHEVVNMQLARRRAGAASTKGRSEVRGGGRKPWRQKGTGRARHGSIRAPQWVGGGKAHKPKPRKYTKAMPRKMRRAALRSALSAKVAEQGIVVLDTLTLPEIKTRLMAQALDQLVGEDSALILLSEKDEEYQRVVLSTNNLPDAKTLLVNYLNIRDLFKYEKIILPLPALDVLVSMLG